MADNYLRQNRIPGNEKLTRPEEISALSKYLKHIKEVQEEHTDLENLAVEVSGRDDSNRMVEINSLSDFLETLEEDTVNLEQKKNINLALPQESHRLSENENLEVERLERHREDIDGVKDIDFLEDGSTKLEDVKDIDFLEDSSDKLKNLKEIAGLEDASEKLNVKDDIKLGDTAEKLRNLREISELEDGYEKIYPKDISDLPDIASRLKNVEDIKGLETEREEIHVDDNISLETDAERLINTIKNLTLSEYLEGLGGDLKNLTLETIVEMIRPSVGLNLKLSEFIERLGGDIKNLTLEDFYERLVGIPLNPDLEDYRENLFGTFRDLTLVDFVERMGGNIRDLHLSDYQESFLGSILDLELSDFLEKLGGNILDVPLSDFIEGFLGDIKDLTLSDFIEALGGDLKELDLVDYQEAIFGELKEPGYPENPGIKDNNILSDIKERTKKALELETTVETVHALMEIIHDASANPVKDMDLSSIILYVTDCIKNHGNDVFGIKGGYDSEWEKKISSSLSDALISVQDSESKDIPEDAEARALETFSNTLTILTESLNKNQDSSYKFGAYDKDKRQYGLDKPSIDAYNKSDDSIRKVDTASNIWLHEKEQEEAFDSYSDSIKEHEIPLSKFPDIRNEFTDLTSTLKSNANALSKLTELTSFADKVTDVSKYLRATAEQTVGGVSNGRTREFLVTEALTALVEGRRVLEKATKANRERLPGNTNEWLTELLSGQGLGTTAKNVVSGAVKKAIGSMTGSTSVNTAVPINRPKNSESETTDFERGNNTVNWGDVVQGGVINEPKKKGLLSSVWNATKLFLSSLSGSTKNGTEAYNFKKNYLQGLGIETTLSELADKDVKSIDSVEDLYDALKNGTYITTPRKFGTLDGQILHNQTIDTNAYWEVVLEPYVGAGNGEFSYLPSFLEMDIVNYKNHGVYTIHDKWIPFTGFELSKSRMISKQIGLFEGEIAFPVAAELTNELRLTIADDAYKSWRWYFQKCMDVSVYNSRPHQKKYYEQVHSLSNVQNGKLTKVDKTTSVVAFYKNITFNVKIYVLTPQYSTIKKYDLLCVLRDFSEEFSGEPDASAGTDLALSFSIVGENPGAIEDEIIKNFLREVEEEEEKEKRGAALVSAFNTIAREQEKKMTDIMAAGLKRRDSYIITGDKKHPAFNPEIIRKDIGLKDLSDKAKKLGSKILATTNSGNSGLVGSISNVISSEENKTSTLTLSKAGEGKTKKKKKKK